MMIQLLETRMLSVLSRLCFLVFMIMAMSIIRQTASADEWKDPTLELMAEFPEEVLPYLPIQIKFTLVNRRDETITLFRIPGNNLDETLRVRVERDDGNLVYEGMLHRDIVYAVGDPMIRMVTLEPGEGISFYSQFSYAWSDDKRPPLFREPDDYVVSFWHLDRYVPGRHELKRPYSQDYNRLIAESSYIRIYSKQYNIKVIIPDNLIPAFEKIKTISESVPYILIGQPPLTFPGRDRESFLKEADRALETYLNEHGNSPWAALAWHSRASVAGGLDNRKMAAEYAERAVKMAEVYENAYTRREAMLILGNALEKLGERDKAHDIMKKYYDERIEWMGLEPPPPRDPDDDRNKAIEKFQNLCDRLEAEGYDPRGLQEVAPEAWEEYHRIEEELWRKHRNRELKAGEYYRQRGAALERITREHTEPVSQEELRERIRRRTEEREKMLRETRERWDRWREENPEEYEARMKEFYEEANRRYREEYGHKDVAEE